MTRRGGAAGLANALRVNAERAAAPVQADHAATERLRAGAQTGNATLPITEIHPDPDQPRRVFLPEAMGELKAAILALGGLENPVQIYMHPGHSRWTIKHGERRWRAYGELVEEGHSGFEQIPVLIVRPPERTPSASRAHRIAQVVENNARQALLPLETAEQYLLIATDGGAHEPIAATEVSALTGAEPRLLQKYLAVATGLTPEERDLLLQEFPEAPLKPAYALARWFETEGRGLDPERRMEAVRRFARERPSEAMVRVVLRDLVPRRATGRQPRKRFTSGFGKGGAFKVQLTLPAELTRDPEAIARAREDLAKAGARLEELERELRGDPGPE